MWLYVMFDLHTDTKEERKCAYRFRRCLMKSGFGMHQFSVYVRYCLSREVAETHIRRVKKALPDSGSVTILRLTDDQFEATLNFVGKDRKPNPPIPQQLEFL